MQNTKYFEMDSNGEQTLSASDDTAVEVQNDGVELSVNVVSGGSDASEAFTYDDEEGFYRITPVDEPRLASELDALFRVLAREHAGEITRLPGDSYEIVVQRDQVRDDDEVLNLQSRTSAEYTLSPDTHFDALVVLDEVLSRLVSN